MMIKEYELSIPVKKKLGIIIRETRLMFFNEYKNDKLIETNPFTKENFCENNRLCHYHTLTKLETNYVREDHIYHDLLEKLDLYFQLEEEEHIVNINKLEVILKNLINAIEYLDYSMIEVLTQKLNELDLVQDCISNLIKDLFLYSINCFINKKVDEDLTEKLVTYLPVFDGLFKAYAYQILGIAFYLRDEYDKSTPYCLKAQELYQPYDVSIGFKKIPLVELHINTNNYYDGMKICNELEEYYLKTSNKGRLLSVYNHLMNYYLLINSIEHAEKYYKEAILLGKDDSKYYHRLSRIYYNWGMHKLYYLKLNEALAEFQAAYKISNIENQLTIINRLLITYSFLKCLDNDDKLINLINQGKLLIDDEINDIEKSIFTYFIYKIENNEHKRYAVNHIIPALKTLINYKVILLFFYEDLYLSV